MNIKRLKSAESAFLARYPGGFQHPEMLAISKKHKMEKMTQTAQDIFSKESFKNPEMLFENIIKIISRASMVSVFEKPKFKEFASSLSYTDRKLFIKGFEKRFYKDEQEGFEMILEILKTGKLAKWTLMTICPVYFRPQIDIFIKPTTTKGIIEHFELKSIKYNPKPTWNFYKEYREIINDMKTKIDSSLTVNNAAFTGFLMTVLEK